MRLTCPNCQAQYEVDDAAIPARGRDVQCSSCGHSWFQKGAVAPDPVTEPAPAAEAPRPPRMQDALTPKSDSDGEDGAFPPIPAQVTPKRALDPAIADILRAEAEREARQRRKEAAALVETQPEFALNDPEAPAAQSGFEGFDFGPPSAADGEPANLDTTSEARAEPRRTQVARKDLLPDIEDINSSLRAGPLDSADPTQMMTPEQAQAHRSHGRGFRLGFSVVLICATAALLVYAYAPVLAQRFPQFEAELTQYVAAMNGLRETVNSWVTEAVTRATALITDLTS